MTKPIFSFFILFAAIFAAAGETFPVGFRMDDAGNVSIGETTFRWHRFRSDWSSVVLDESQCKLNSGFPLRTSDCIETVETWHGFQVNAKASVENRDTIRYAIKFHAESPIDTPTLAMVLNLSAGESYHIEADGREIKLPVQNRGPEIFDKEVDSFLIELDGRIVTWKGRFRLLVQDNRKWNINSYVIRICPAVQWNGKIRDSALSATIKIQSPETTIVDLSGVANRAFADQQAGDGKGGWTDQGPDNDLRMIQPGTLTVQGVDFNILNPAQNKERSCVVLSSGQKGSLSEVSVTPAGAGKSATCLYLLHASTRPRNNGSSAGSMEVEFADGRRTEFSVVSGRDVGNWRQPSRLANASVAWTAESSKSFVGLYLSQFPINGMPKKITFRAAGGGDVAWMLVGCSLGNRKLQLQQIESATYCVEGDNWIPLEFTGQTKAGSPLDFSALNDAPAGKYGPVIVNADGHFAFRNAPEKRIRFLGPNLIGMANYLPRELADDFAAKAARLGYNAIRFHHFDGLLAPSDAANSLAFSQASLDQLDYLFAELKKRGIYLCLDIYCSRPIRAGDNIEECRGREVDLLEMKILTPISPSAMANWKEFARKLLTHRNPYTGMTWAEDPALAIVNLINENPLIEIWNLCPPLIPLYEAKYVEYLWSRGLDTPENREMRGTLFIQFLNELQVRCIEEQRRFLKDELKLTALISDVNMLNSYALHGVREHLDFVDNHNYWGHPIFLGKPWELPYSFIQDSSIGHDAATPREIMPTRIFGKPFTVTEFNYCNPNSYRMEGAPLMGGYAALQDWDGLFRFAWSHNNDAMKNMNAPRGFDIVNDPQAQLGERILNLLFRNEYVAAARPAFAFAWTPDSLENITSLHHCGTYPLEFSLLGLYGRIGSLNANADFPGVQKLNIPAGNWQSQLPQNARSALNGLLSRGTITSANGEITLDAKQKTLKIIVPKGEVLTCSGQMSGRIMRLENGSRYQTVALFSVDGKPLAESRTLLLFQLPNLAGTKQKFSSERHDVLESWGELPLLVERASVDVGLALPGKWAVEALRLDGSPNGPVASECRDGILRFRADTAARPGGVMVYHLIRQEGK